MNIAENTVNAFFQEPVLVTITVNKITWLHLLHILPKKRKFIIKPIVLGTLLRISKEVYAITDPGDTSELKDINLVAKTLEIALSDTEHLINVLAFVITNSKKMPSQRLKNFLRENLDTNESFKLITVMVGQLNVMSFINSITLIKRVSLLNKGEIIAPGESQEESKNPLDSDLTK
jgi:PDZ domain-containing secreted protein